MPGLQLSGLASGFDWKTLVDSLMQLERAPVARLETERTNQSKRLSALEGVRSRLQELQSSLANLRLPTLASGRTARLATAGSSWSVEATPSAAPGSHTLEVLALATAARRVSTQRISAPVSTSNDLSSLTIATLPTAVAPSEGFFTINGEKITVASTDSLAQILDRIETATAGEVRASYDPITDRLTLNATSSLFLGAANDTSTFLSALRLSTTGPSSAASTAALGRTALDSPLASARLAQSITAVDATGTGTFRINGETFTYNVHQDSLATVLDRINAASIGVVAAYDSTTDRVSLRNSVTGDLGIHVNESAGGLLAALAIDTDSSLVRGSAARFTVDGGAERSSNSNALGPTSHGIPGLTVTARSLGNDTITVSPDSAPLRSALDAFIDRYNEVQTYLEEQTKVTVTDGKVTNSLLSGNREVQAWGQTLRAAAFSASDEIPGRLRRLDDLGIDFASGKSLLTIKDPARFEAALRDRPAEVDALLRHGTSGFSARLDTLLKTTLGISPSSGALTSQTAQINRSTAGIGEQIAALERRLAQRRSQLESSFIAMEAAQSRLQQMQSQLSRAFNLGGTTNK